jgi:hypothetical protein
MIRVSLSAGGGGDVAGLELVGRLDPLPALRMFSVALLFANYTLPTLPL